MGGAGGIVVVDGSDGGERELAAERLERCKFLPDLTIEYPLFQTRGSRLYGSGCLTELIRKVVAPEAFGLRVDASLMDMDLGGVSEEREKRVLKLEQRLPLESVPSDFSLCSPGLSLTTRSKSLANDLSCEGAPGTYGERERRKPFGGQDDSSSIRRTFLSGRSCLGARQPNAASARRPQLPPGPQKQRRRTYECRGRPPRARSERAR